jgi:hypoxanthine phosphoribosyltransferase
VEYWTVENIRNWQVKEFLKFETIQENCIALTQKLIDDNYVPDYIFLILRGGAFVGNIISEYYKYKMPEKKILIEAVVATSYSSYELKNSEVVIRSWTREPALLRRTDKVLLCDDTYDSGNTINAIASHLKIFNDNTKIVVHDYKHSEKEPEIKPDFWCREMTREQWINYPTELIGLTNEEIRNNYSEKLQSYLMR